MRKFSIMVALIDSAILVLRYSTVQCFLLCG